VTLGELHQRVRSEFRLPGFSQAFFQLLDYYFQLPSQTVWTRPGFELSPPSCQKMITDLEAFLLGKPLAHITGRAWFFGLEFIITPQVLIPRPDSECLLSQALALSPAHGHILDIGCGSGVLAISLALHRPDLMVEGTDSSFAALRLARLNACRHGVSAGIVWHHTDLIPQPDLCPKGGFDLILSNPPYISTEEMEKLDPSVRDHEPRSALDGGLDGLDFYRRIISLASSVLRPGGLLLFEVGYRQADAVSALLEKNAYQDIRRHQDFSGIDRVVLGQYSSVNAS